MSLLVHSGTAGNLWMVLPHFPFLAAKHQWFFLWHSIPSVVSLTLPGLPHPWVGHCHGSLDCRYDCFPKMKCVGKRWRNTGIGYYTSYLLNEQINESQDSCSRRKGRWTLTEHFLLSNAFTHQNNLMSLRLSPCFEWWEKSIEGPPFLITLRCSNIPLTQLSSTCHAYNSHFPSQAFQSPLAYNW